MVYYYAFTGHKYGLDRVKRAAAILNKLKAKGQETMLLVNDFRAGLVAREFGVADAVTIETIQDIDAIAKVGDSIIIDSPEDDHGRLVKYLSDFKSVFRFAEGDDDKSIHGETMFTIDCQEESCISSIIIDDIYFEEHKKEERVLFFLGDSDADKTILNNATFFKSNNMELLLGHYFYVRYEDALSEIFDTLHEPEEYMNLICSSKRVVTSSFQTAIEASVAGAEVLFVENHNLTKKEKKILKLFKVILIVGFDKDMIKQNIFNNVSLLGGIIERNETIVKKIINRL